MDQMLQAVGEIAENVDELESEVPKKLQLIHSQVVATGEAVEESNLILQRISDKLQLVADRIAENNGLLMEAMNRIAENNDLTRTSNELLTTVSNGAPRGAAAQVARAVRNDVNAAPYAQHQ